MERSIPASIISSAMRKSEERHLEIEKKHRERMEYENQRRAILELGGEILKLKGRQVAVGAEELKEKPEEMSQFGEDSEGLIINHIHLVTPPLPAITHDGRDVKLRVVQTSEVLPIRETDPYGEKSTRHDGFHVEIYSNFSQPKTTFTIPQHEDPKNWVNEKAEMSDLVDLGQILEFIDSELPLYYVLAEDI